MLLAESLHTREGRSYPMAGMIPGSVRMTERLQHFGYCQARFEEGGSFRGHEFHYSNWEEESNLANAWTVRRHADGSERMEGYQRGKPPCLTFICISPKRPVLHPYSVWTNGILPTQAD